MIVNFSHLSTKGKRPVSLDAVDISNAKYVLITKFKEFKSSTAALPPCSKAIWPNQLIVVE